MDVLLKYTRPKGLPNRHGNATMFAVMSVSELAQVADPLWRAAHANDLMWTKHPDRTGLRSLRARSIQEALAGGHTPQAVASRLGVVVSDLEWMTRDAPSWPYRNSRPNGAKRIPTVLTTDEPPTEISREDVIEGPHSREVIPATHGSPVAKRSPKRVT